MQYPTQLPSVQKTLTKLLSVSTNRSCADCRSTLVDPSQIHASVSPELESSQTRIPRYKNFRLNHQSFAPPSEDQDATHRILHIPTSYDPPVDPALVAPARVGGHGVFVCAPCGAAHKLLGKTVAVVHSVQDVASWSREEVETLAQSGGNARSWKVLEAYIPHHWESKRPKADSDIADRLTFIRAKYEALAFILPPPGPLAFHAWRRIVKMHPEWRGLWGADLHASAGSEIFNAANQIRKSTMHMSASAVAPRKSELPDRLVDYFCVVTASEYADPSIVVRDISQTTTPDDILLAPQVADCFPLPDAYGKEQEFPEHVSTFLFPDGCRPSTTSLPPSFFTFVLTASNGDRLYGGVLRLYDDNQDVEYLRQAVENSNYSGKLPLWMQEERHGFASSRRSKDSAAPDVIFLPKCLVVISHYPFFDLWRKFLLQIYRIALVGAPLPIERFIANFTCEVPLPPPGKIRIKFGFTSKDNWCIERPPENQLPLADFSFQPLFASLSIHNVLLVFACLLQESRVALVSKYYGILGPVSEALTSLLFPFHWEGMYLPVLPYHMLDILDAPVPFLLGLHSRYLVEYPPKNRPHGVVFVDLDRDEVHLGFEDSSSSARQIPCLPERQAAKLKAKLDVHAATAYLTPPSGQVATVTVGEGEQVPLTKRTSHLSVTASEARPSVASGVIRRRDVFSGADRAYRDNELQVPIHGFLSEHGQFFGQDHPTPSGTTSKSKLPLFRRGLARASSFESEEPDAEQLSNNLLDKEDPPGFCTTEIRTAFLRFFVSLLMDYRVHLTDETFRVDDFISGLHLSSSSTELVRSFVKTQMFDRFIDERRENPLDPEVKFFDESIAAKIKRSKRTVILSNIGRQAKKVTATAFLEDSSTMITETFTPPPPSNWGLPDDGRTYSYGTFPSLNPDLFGKIRPPRKWQNRRGSLRMSRRTSVRTAVSEQAVFAKAMVPVMRSGSSLLAATRRGAKSLEQAIAALSAPFVTPAGQPNRPLSKNHVTSNHSNRGSSPDRLSVMSDITVPSELGLADDLVSSAEEVVLNARRKQAILLGVFTMFQVECRARFGFSRTKKPSLHNILQLNSSDTESVMAVKDYFAATRLQAALRGIHARHLFRIARHSASIIQAVARGRKCRFAFSLISRALVTAQALCRGFVVRIVLARLVSSRLVHYRQVIFHLWRKTSTSLCYRSIFWWFIQRDRLLPLCIAEDEVRRLWTELGIALPRVDKAFDDPSLCREKRQKLCDSLKLQRADFTIPVLSDSARLGVTNQLYVQSLLLHESEAGTRKSVATNQKQSGITREAAERIQVYDRLSMAALFAHEDRLTDFFHRFRVPLKDKRKKVMLSETIWSDYTLANESSKLMLELFPELKDVSDIHFREPCKKTRSRFKYSQFRPDPLEPRLRARTLLRDRIRYNIVLVADNSLRLVPSLSARFARLEEQRRSAKREMNRKLYLRMGNNVRTQDLSEFRLRLMKELVQPTTPRCVSLDRSANYKKDSTRCRQPASKSLAVGRVAKYAGKENRRLNETLPRLDVGAAQDLVSNPTHRTARLARG